MAVMRLVPSTYYLSNSSYLSVSNVANMYANTDSTTYGTVTHGRNSTNNTYYMYLRGFNFSDIPSNAEVSSFTIKIKASATGHTTSTSSSYYMSLYNNTAAIGSTTASARLTTSVQTITFSNGSMTWDTLSGYGANFGIRIPLRRASSNTADVVSVYGAEIEVTYVVPNPRTITTTLIGDGEIDPEGTETYYDGDEYNLTIVPTISSDTVTATKDGVEITLTHHSAGSQTVTATAESLETGFSTSGISFYTSSSSSGHNFNYAIGHTAESPGSTISGSGSWTYVKSSSGSTSGTGYADFSFDFSEIPPDATITSVVVKCYGAVEDTSQTTSHADITLFSGNTQKGALQKFTSSTNSIITLSDVGTWTAEELHEAKLRFAVGYYGGHIFGITWTVTYNAPEYYSYSYTIDGDADIVVTIGDTVETNKIFVKVNSAWKQATDAYKKVNGAWIAQSDLTRVFQTGVNYIRGN